MSVFSLYFKAVKVYIHCYLDVVHMYKPQG